MGLFLVLGGFNKRSSLCLDVAMGVQLLFLTEDVRCFVHGLSSPGWPLTTSPSN